MAFGCGAVLIACGDGTSKKGPKLELITSTSLTAPANTTVPPIQIAVRDAAGNPSPNQTVTFTVTAGGGTITSGVATSDANGIVVAPTWRLGKQAILQTLRAMVGTDSLVVSATVQTDFQIVVRFWGTTPVSQSNQNLFFTAAARIKGIITGDIADVNATGFDPAQCGVVGVAKLNEVIDDVLIYASVAPIDGPGKVLAQTFVCATRDQNPKLPAIGVMSFDSDDFATLAAQGHLQEVVTHEMLHVIGVGILWDSPDFNLLANGGSADPRYTGAQGRQGCLDVGGIVTCATDVPVEGNSAGPGTQDSHWRESTFGNELMTGFLNAGANPISLLTIRSLADFTYVVNAADSDSYTIPGGSFRANLMAPNSLTGQPGWETVRGPIGVFDKSGRFRLVTPK
jgi:hypothetical protein